MEQFRRAFGDRWLSKGMRQLHCKQTRFLLLAIGLLVYFNGGIVPNKWGSTSGGQHETSGWVNTPSIGTVYAQSNNTSGNASAEVSGAAALDSDELPPEFIEPLQILLAPNNEDEGGGLLIALNEQLDIAFQHTGFLQNSLTEDDLPEVRRHTEHIVNILDGENGAVFGDLDRDGQAQNPGDGIGASVYMEEATAQIEAMLEAGGAIATDEAYSSLVQQIDVSLQTGTEDISLALEVALKVFAADSIIEVQEFADELTALVTDIQQDALTALDAGNQLIEAASANPGDSSIPTRISPARLAELVEQVEIAVQHTGFLQNSLTDDDLPEVRRHAEHIVNILDGSEGSIFGDLDRDGQAQNPGNGTGVRLYLSEIGAWASNAVDQLGSDVNPEGPVAALQTVSERGQEEVDLAFDAALQIFASDTAAEAQKFADELTKLVLTIQQSSQEAATANDQLDDPENQSATPEVQAQIIQTISANLTVLTAANEQAQIAVQHTDFLQSALTDEDLPEMRRHAEHIANILDGEDGAVFGDLDRDGQVQNPGDGIGLRFYLDESIRQFPNLAELLEKAPLLSDDTASVLAAAQAITASRSTIDQALEKATQIFAADTIEEGIVFGDEVTALVIDIQNSIADSEAQLTQVAQLIQRIQAAAPTEAGGPPPSPADGDLWVNPVDGSAYLFVADGPFTMGAVDDADALTNEEPSHGLTLSGFWIQQTETTNQQYAACVDEGECTPPENDLWNQPELGDHPVTHVDWQQATTYAAWLSASLTPSVRLPTEAEWEKACRGTDDRLYPWGSSIPTEALTNFNNAVGGTQPVGSYPAGASPIGALDMSGNVYEWTSTLNAGYPYSDSDGREDPDADGRRIVRGGSYYYTQYQMRCSARVGFSPTAANAHFGFRLVVEQSQQLWTNPIDQALYVRIDGGEFSMGSTAEQAILGNEEPQHLVAVDALWLQQTETTNEQYARCVDAGVCTPPTNALWDQPQVAQHPVSHLNWQQANTYAAWAGGRLPTEAEWERACRSDDGRAYPWGDDPPERGANEKLSNFDNLLGETAAVGSYPEGASAQGLLDMSGNVFEWTSSLDTAYPYAAEDGREDGTAEGRRVIRGGSYFYTQYQLRCAARTALDPASANQHVGLRVAIPADAVTDSPTE